MTSRDAEPSITPGPTDEPQHHSCGVVYVCLLSDYTVASAQAVKHIRPARVIAISSAYVNRSGSEGRFVQLLQTWRVPVEVVGSTPESPFPAEGMVASRTYLGLHLRPRLEAAQRHGARLFANLTGSTKAAAIALKECWEWDELHYTAEGARARIEVLDRGVFGLAPLGLLEEASLLSAGIRSNPDPWQGTEERRLREAADALHSDCVKGDRSSVLQTHDQLLRALWFDSRSAAWLNEKGVSFDGGHAALPPGPLADFLATLTLGNADVITTDSGGLRIPASRTHRWARFVCGGWWEFLVAAWVAEAGCDLVPHVVIPRPGAESDDLEADILMRCPSGEMRAIECKVQPPGRSGFADMVKLLNDLAHRFGKTKGAFAVSPAFWWQVDTQTRHAFEESCAARRIDVLDSREAVVRWLGSLPSSSALPVYEARSSTGRTTCPRPREGITAMGSIMGCSAVGRHLASTGLRGGAGSGAA